MRLSGSLFTKITDKEAIMSIVRSYTGNGNTFIPGLVCNKEMLIYEGVRVFGVVTDIEKNEVRITLTNSDSNYSRPIGTVLLSDIDYLQLL